jgi:hypothetical protein
LGADGKLREPGWSDSLVLDYDRKAIASPRWRIKEWDYYCILAGDEGLALTVADNGYMGLVSATVFDFSIPWETTDTIMTAFPMGSWGLPSSSRSGVTEAKAPGISMRFEASGGERRLLFSWPTFGTKAAPPPPRVSCCAPLTPEDLAAARAASPTKGEPVKVGLEGEILLREPRRPGSAGADPASLVIATPFKKPKKAFYYNQKINCLSAEGAVRFGGIEHRLGASSGHPAFGVLDWGRGVWPWSNAWLWGSASGLARRGADGGESFGFNIGYGFGDTSAASENMVFYGGEAHKIGRLRIELNERDFMKSWRAVSEDGRFDMTLEPILDRAATTDLGLLASIQHQVFGDWKGYAILDDGSRVEVEGLRGFCEKVVNRW